MLQAMDTFVVAKPKEFHYVKPHSVCCFVPVFCILWYAHVMALGSQDLSYKFNKGNRSLKGSSSYSYSYTVPWKNQEINSVQLVLENLFVIYVNEH